MKIYKIEMHIRIVQDDGTVVSDYWSELRDWDTLLKAQNHLDYLGGASDKYRLSVYEI